MKVGKSIKQGKQYNKSSSPKEIFKNKGVSKNDDWYETAYKRFSISLNTKITHRDLLATLVPPVKSELK